MKDGDENMRDDGENMIYLCKVFLGIDNILFFLQRYIHEGNVHFKLQMLRNVQFFLHLRWLRSAPYGEDISTVSSKGFLSR